MFRRGYQLKHGRRAAAGRAHVGRLPPIETRGREQHRIGVGIKPNVHLQGCRDSVPLYHPLAWLGIFLRDILCGEDFGPHLSCQLVAVVGCLAAMSLGRLKKVGAAIVPQGVGVR